MEFFFDLGDKYARNSSWKDFALTKFCLFAMGLFCGTFVATKSKKPARIAARLVFIATYIPLMAKVFKLANEKEEIYIEQI